MEDLLEKHRPTVQGIQNALRSADTVLICTHEHPDGDAVGSSLALLSALRMQDKTVTAYAPDKPPHTLSFLPGFERLTVEKPDVVRYDAVVVLDATRLHRTGLGKELSRHNLTICLDHHQGNPGEGRFNLVMPQAAATAQILVEFFKMTDTPLTNDMATCLLAGIFTDTGSFMHDSTTPEVMKTASWLMSKGARLSHIAHETYQKKELSGLRVWGRALSRVMVNKKTGASVSVITPDDLKECRADLEDLSGVVNMLNTLPDTKFALLLAEYEPGLIKASLRSEPHKNIDVSKIAARLGGGGHKLAAGFEVPGHLVQWNGKWRVVAKNK